MLCRLSFRSNSPTGPLIDSVSKKRVGDFLVVGEKQKRNQLEEKRNKYIHHQE